MPLSGPHRRLLAFLALHPGPHERDALAARVWPDLPTARANLRTAVWGLRRARTCWPGWAGRELLATAGRLDSPPLLALARHDAGLVALADGRHGEAADLLHAALDGDAAVSRPAARLAAAEVMAYAGAADAAAAEIRRAALEPVGPADQPWALVPRMSGYTLTGRAQAPVEDVWKLLFDPSRFPGWFTAVESDGVPDHPMPQISRTDQVNGRVLMTCQVTDIDFAWQLAEDGDGTGITLRVTAPEPSAPVLAEKRPSLAASVVALAEREHRPVG